MSQSFFNALFMGAKESKSAKKIVKFVAYYGFITVGFGLMVLFVPYEPLQNIVNERIPEKWPVVVMGLFSFICLVFLLKEKFWAPCVLLALTLGDMVLIYIEDSSIPGAFGSMKLVFFLSAAQATYFLMKQNKNDTAAPTDNNDLS